MNLPFGILKPINHGSNQFWSVSKCLILVHPLYYFFKSRRKTSKVIFVGWMFGFWSCCLPEAAALEAYPCRQEVSPAKLPGAELRRLSWGGGCSPKGAEARSTILFLRFPVLEKALNGSPKRGAPSSEGTGTDCRRDWTLFALAPSARQFEGDLLNFLQPGVHSQSSACKEKVLMYFLAPVYSWDLEQLIGLNVYHSFPATPTVFAICMWAALALYHSVL